MALDEFGAEEQDHFGKVAFRAPPRKAGGKPGKIFMTLWLEENRAVLMLTVEQQAELHEKHPQVFHPHPSKWGAKGATFVELAPISERVFRTALELARSNAG